MKEEFQYKSTPNGKPPSGHMRKGTFRDISMNGCDPETIEKFDLECMERGFTRLQLAYELLGQAQDGGDHQRFYDIFSKTKSFSSLIQGMGKKISRKMEVESATVSSAPDEP